MKLNGGDVFVESGVGFSEKVGLPLPLVRVTVTAEDGQPVMLHMTPGNANRETQHPHAR